MNTLELLRLVKKKIFEPKKKIIFDTEGNKILTNTQYYDNNNKNISINDLKILSESDGWNVADKDYVDLKISELYKFVKTIPPTAPNHSDLVKQFPTNNSTIQKSIQKTIFSSVGVIDGENIVFFSPGLVLKKNWNISDFTIFFDNIIEEELYLVVNNIIESKITQISKIKTNGKQQIFSADAKYTVDSSKVIIFQIKLPLKTTLKASLQITVEI